MTHLLIKLFIIIIISKSTIRKVVISYYVCPCHKLTYKYATVSVTEHLNKLCVMQCD